MSTWDDKPNDYETAVAWALEERGKAARFAAALEECGADFISEPCTVTQGFQILGREFERRQRIAQAALAGLKE